MTTPVPTPTPTIFAQLWKWFTGFLGGISLTGWLVVICLVFAGVAYVEHKNALTAEAKEETEHANDLALQDTVTTYIKTARAKGDTLVSAQRDLVQQKVVVDSLQASLAKKQHVVVMLQDSFTVHIKRDSEIVSMIPGASSVVGKTSAHMATYNTTIDGPPVEGTVHLDLLLPPGDTATHAARLTYALQPSPFVADINLGCDSAHVPVITATTPDWVSMKLSRGTINPGVCIPVARPTTAPTLGEVAKIGGIGAAIGAALVIILHATVK